MVDADCLRGGSLPSDDQALGNIVYLLAKKFLIRHSEYVSVVDIKTDGMFLLKGDR